MVNFFTFTKRKFLTFPLVWQHKQCAELLTQLYHQCLNEENVEHDWEIYRTFLGWMGLNNTLETLPSKHLLAPVANQVYWHQKMAQISSKEHGFLPTVRKGDVSHAQPSWPITVYLEHLRSAHNVGSILRTVEALSLGQVAFSEKTPFTTHAQVKKTAMGASEWVTCYQVENLLSLPRPLIVLETSDNATSIFDYLFPSSFTLAVGNETYGCSDHLLQVADDIIEIPLRGRKNSLNVANAFALTAGEITRQRLTNFKGHYD